MAKVVSRKKREAQAEKILNDFLESLRFKDPDTGLIENILVGDAKVYSREEWDGKRGEVYGRNAFATLAVDGSYLYEVFNYGESPKYYERLSTMLDNAGFYFELGYAWSLHVYERDASWNVEKR
jgi:hypothetical protein